MALKIGVVRDEKFFFHLPGLAHPERPGRLKSIYRMLDKDFADGLITIEPEPVSLEHLELVHTPEYIRKILNTAGREITNLSSDTLMSSTSYVSAWLAAGGCIKGLQSLISGRCDVCFALVRPPGHHAKRDRAGGFCIFNNIGIVASYALERHGFQRILIVDWDVHHGDGLQELFWEDNRVVYFSSHYTGWFPGTGDWEEAGAGAGLGYTINLPIPKDVEDSDLLYIYWKTLGPLIKRYKPELILVAAGFDGHHRDPIGRTRLTEQFYRWTTEMLLELRDAVRSAPMLFVLEGGFDVSATAACVREVLDVLTTKGRRQRVPIAMSARAMEIVEKAELTHKKYHVWTD